MVLFTDPIAHTLWIGRATPRVWLQSGRNVTIEHAPTRYGRLSFSILAASDTTISANITFSSTLVSKRAAFASPQQGFEWPEGSPVFVLSADVPQAYHHLIPSEAAQAMMMRGLHPFL